MPKAKQLYDAHNVDSILWTKLAKAQNKKEFQKYAENALQVEKNLYKTVNAVFCCSEIDKKELERLNNGKLKAYDVPNGVDTEGKMFYNGPEKHLFNEILFCGNLDYYPNEEGLMWFFNEIFPIVKAKMPGIKLTIVGTSKQNKTYKLLSV